MMTRNPWLKLSAWRAWKYQAGRKKREGDGESGGRDGGVETRVWRRGGVIASSKKARGSTSDST